MAYYDSHSPLFVTCDEFHFGTILLNFVSKVVHFRKLRKERGI